MLKVIRAADGGSAVAEVLARHIVEAAFERPVLAQILVYPHLGIEISRGVGIAAAAGTPDEVARKAPAIGHCELRCQLEHGKMIVLYIALLSLLRRGFAALPEVVDSGCEAKDALVPEGGGADAERIVVGGAEQVLVDVLYRGAEHEGRAAVGMLELYHIRHAVADIGGINRLPGTLHIARGYEIAKLGIEDAAAVGGLQGMPRRETVIGARRVDMVARGMLPVLFRRNLLRTEVNDAEAVACHESPLADVVIQLGVEVLVVGMVGVTGDAVLLDGETALETCRNPEIGGDDRSGVFYHHEGVGGVVLIGRGLGFFLRASVVADMLGTEGKEDAGAVVGERAGIVGLQMIGAHVIGWGVGEMVAGVGLHRINFEHILRGRCPEQIEFGALVGVVVHGGS